MSGVRVPATSANLGPGFDSFGVAIDLWLTARIVPRTDRRIIASGQGAGELPDDDDNLLWRSLAAACARAEVTTPEVSVAVHSDIPLERGLGSSAAAIVAGIGLARVAAGARLSDHDVVVLAAELEGHPDNVAAAVFGGLVVVARGDAGELVVRRTRPHPRLRPLVCVPEWRQPTAAARAALPTSVPLADAATSVGRAGHVLGALVGLWSAAVPATTDRLHEPTRLANQPGAAGLVAALRAAGVHAWLSGAGGTVTAAVPAADADLVARCGGIARDHGYTATLRRWDLAGLVALA